MRKKDTDQSPKLFTDDEIVPVQLTPEPVTCLGMTFSSDEERREYFRAELRRKLPELRHIEGFPIGEDEDIIALSDPPYYTACPNPWLNNFIDEWEQEKTQLEAGGKRTKDFSVWEPYASDVSEGKNSPIYTAHFYHTKVPHKIVMKYLLHYTQPGDIVIDNFAGTGMTGVACNEMGNESSVKNIGGNNKDVGIRNCILGDLSLFASFITHNYTFSIDNSAFLKAANNIFNELEKEYSWMYSTTHDNDQLGKVNYFVWSEVQICPNCSHEFSYWDAAVDIDKNLVKDIYTCPHCGFSIKKKDSQKLIEEHYDEVLNESYPSIKFVPVMVNYSVGKSRYERPIIEYDRKIIDKINSMPFPKNFPTNKMMGIGERWGDTWRAGYHIGFDYVHNFYTRRNLIILSVFYDLICSYKTDDRVKSYLLAWFTLCQSRLHIMNRYSAKHHRHVGPLANTLYVSGTPAEISPFYFIKSKISDNNLVIRASQNVINQVCSADNIAVKNNSIDYIFTDPPFGGNIMYSELNYIYESWLKLFTNNKEEAITNSTQGKGIFQYQAIMTKCFAEYYRILRPGKWMTVEFSNTSASVWNAIQHAIQQAGFIIVNVSDLNKGRGGLHGIVTVTAVNQDLAITCFKPSDKLLSRIKVNSGSQQSAQDFIEELLIHLPVHIEKDNSTTAIVERSAKILYDRLIIYYIQHGYAIPMDAREFQQMLHDSFIERDGMFFTASQAVEYEEKRAHTTEFVPMALFISSEAEGIEWLKRHLSKKPQTYQELQPEWMKDMAAPKKGDIIPELRDILEENFIEESDGTWRNPDAEKAADLEIIRNRRMMKEFTTYVEQATKPKSKRMKDCRLAVLQYGFKECYRQKRFADIVAVGDHIPESLLTEDEVLLQYYDIALTRI